MQLTVYRHKRACDFDFSHPMEALLESSTYVRRAPLEEGSYRKEPPYQIDCLTLVHFLFFKNGVRIPLTYIGNMPDQLSKLPDWEVHEITFESLQNGDIVFTKKRSEKVALITHAAIFLKGMFLHTTQSYKRAVLQSVPGFFNTYEQFLKHNEAVRYIDERDSEGRKLSGGNQFRSASTSGIQYFCPIKGQPLKAVEDSGFNTPTQKREPFARARSAPPPELTEKHPKKLRRTISGNDPSRPIPSLPRRLSTEDLNPTAPSTENEDHFDARYPLCYNGSHPNSRSGPLPEGPESGV